MTPEASLAEFVDVFLSRNRMPDPFIAAVAHGVSEIGEALGEAQQKTGNWGGMLAKLRSGAAVINAALGHLRGDPGLERFVKFAETRAMCADAMIAEIVRLQADASTLVR